MSASIRPDVRAGTWELNGPVRVHRVKSAPNPFRDVWDGRKSYEVRVDDRGYRTGDEMRLCEWTSPLAAAESGSTADLSGYTGREIRVEIVHKTPGGRWGLPHGLCVLGIRVLELVDAPARTSTTRRRA